MVNENNRAVIQGMIMSEFSYSHGSYGERFFRTIVQVERKSGTSDYIPVVISEKVINPKKKWAGKEVKVEGSFRSSNQPTSNGKAKLLLFLFAYRIGRYEGEDTNEIFLDGFICKHPTCRKTPLGREITELLVAVPRPYAKSDYIPCIAWGSVAERSFFYLPGDQVILSGRIQSRDYVKHWDDGGEELKTAYEVSINQLRLVTETDNE